MSLNSKSIIASISGLSAIGSAIYYIHKRKQNNSQGYQHLQLIRQYLLSKNSNDLVKVQNMFNNDRKILFEKRLLDLDQNDQIKQEIGNRICYSSIEGDCYICYDCSIVLKNNQYKDFDNIENNEVNQVYCMDCFDINLHKGHKYQVKYGYRGMCDCGNSHAIDESRFCSKHKGFQEVLVDFDYSFPDLIKQDTIHYFIELFYILINGQADKIHYRLIKMQETAFDVINDMTIYEHFNIIFSLILDFITDLMNDNNSFLFCFSQVLQKSFDKPTRINTKKDRLSILTAKNNFDKKETILEYLLRFQNHFTKTSSKKFYKFIYILSCADKDFADFKAKKYLKLINFAISEKQNDKRNQKTIQYGSKRLFKIFISQFEDQEFAHKTFIREEQYLCNLQIVFLLLTNKKQFTVENMSIIQHYLKILFSYPNNIEDIINFEDILENFLEDTIQYFEYIPKVHKDPLFNLFYNFMNKFEFLMNLQNCFNKLTIYSCQNEISEIKKQKILKVICKKYRQHIEKLFSEKQDGDQDNQLTSISLVFLIINIIIISEGTEINQQNVMNTFKKNFFFRNDQEIEEFISKITYILTFNFISFRCQFKVEDLLSLIGQYKQNISVEFYLQSYLSQKDHFYDSLIFSTQLLLLAQPSTKSIFGTMIHFKANESHLVKSQIYLFSQIFFDQTPFVNINMQLNNLLSKNKEKILQTINYTTQSVINNLILCNPGKCKTYSDFMEMSKFILDEKLIKNTLSMFGEFNEENNYLNILPKKNIIITSYNISRYCSYLILDEYEKIYMSLDNQKYQHGLFSKLFSFQNEYILNIFIDIQALDRLRTIQPESSSSEAILIAEFYFDILADLISYIDQNKQSYGQEFLTKLQSLKKEITSEESRKVFHVLCQFYKLQEDLKKDGVYNQKLDRIKLLFENQQEN